MKYAIENDFLKIEVSELGATLVRFIDKKTDTDMVVGFDSDQEYIDNAQSVGASVGRNANRIADARFSLNGVEYQLNKNDGNNNLHGGGMNGFGYRYYKLKEKTDDELVFEYDALDGEEGFPGNLHVEVSYKLVDNNLRFTYSGISDKDTIFNMTNHSYFNLGDENILNQYLKVCTDKYSPVDDAFLTLDEVRNVEGTHYDFVDFRNIGEQITALPTAIDNNYVWEVMGHKLLCQYKNDKIQIDISSDLPDMHIYTSYYMPECSGKDGRHYGQYAGICFEAQYYPNAINYSNYIKPILKANEKVTHYINYEVKNGI